MPRGRPVAPIVLNDNEKLQLLSLANSRALPYGLVRRAQIVLACADGEANSSIAKRLKLTNYTVGKWRRRWNCWPLMRTPDPSCRIGFSSVNGRWGASRPCVDV